MCYYLYGAFWGDCPESEYVSVSKKYEYRFARGTKHDVKNAVKDTEKWSGEDFRITDWCCDCESPVGKHDPEDEMIKNLSGLITELLSLPDAKQINLCKTWTGHRNKKEIKVSLKETDIALLLADLQENCLYTIDK